MRFSIIIPAYNAQNHIGRAIESVLNQDFPDWEMIIINDGSTDNTKNIILSYISKYPDIRIKLINQLNMGIAAARNSGIRNSRAEFIAFLDADDIWYKGKLEAVSNILMKSKNVDVVCHDEYIVEENTNLRRRAYYGPKKLCNYFDLLFKGNILSTSATTIRRERLLEAGLFSEDRGWIGVEDYDLWLKLAKLGAEFFFLNEVYGEYRLHDSNTTKNTLVFNSRALNVIDYHFKQLSSVTPFQRYLFAKRKFKIHQGTAVQLIKERKFCSACKYIVKSF